MRKLLFWLALLVFALLARPEAMAQAGTISHQVEPGDTWAALAWRYGLDEAMLAPLRSINRQRQPTIGSTLSLPEGGKERQGRLLRVNGGGLLQTAVRHHRSPWLLALENGLNSPYHPPLYRAVFVPGSGPLRELPAGFTTLELSQLPAHPGQALAYRAEVEPPRAVQVMLDNRYPFAGGSEGVRRVGLVGTGAFFGAGAPELTVQVDAEPLWTQPLAYADLEWDLQQITLTGEAAQIDQQSIAEERARLDQLWSAVAPTPLWTGPFQLPIDSYLDISSRFGARRSYNGGPYRTYHEGVDFSAYGGTPVLAPAAGRVVLAEELYVRGGAVIIDHGLGVYSGYYHLSRVIASPGQLVQPGDLLGEVGTTGLSTGNHLHWDFLVNGTWVDASAWVEQGLGCWVLAGLERPCTPASES